MDRLQSMKTFQAVVDMGSFAAAARTLDLSTTVVTRLVADLEQHLGTRLLQRTTRRLSLTDAGETYLHRVRAILAEIEEAEGAASAHAKELKGVLHVCSSSVLASYFLAPRVSDWHALHPHVALDLHTDPNPQNHIEEHDLTLLVVSEGFDGQIVARPLSSAERVLCAAPAYLKSKAPLQRPEQLAAHAMLMLKGPLDEHGTRVLRLQRDDDSSTTAEQPVHPLLLSNSVEVALSAALAGSGIAAFPRVLIAPHLEQGTLVQVLPGWIAGRYTVYAALPTRKFVPARTRAFMDFLARLSGAR